MKSRRELLRVGLPMPIARLQQLLTVVSEENDDSHRPVMDVQVRHYNGSLIIDAPTEALPIGEPDEKDKLER